MPTIIFLFFRRMRAPLLVLIGAYAISIGGLVLIPGVDDTGKPWRFDFFHAFYFVSFMGSTIGFGEIPYAFTDAQRLWTTAMIYITVISWLYAIGTILSLIQDQAFRRAVTEQRFTRNVKAIRQPFYLVCGYGETGSLLVRALNRRGLQSVVIDIDPERINQLTLENLDSDVPSLCGDADAVVHLIEAGLQHRCCDGVLALTQSEEINLKIAITSKLLRPALKVICRATTESTTANLASFNTDHIINPFTIFADHLAMALRTPSVHLLYNWLISVPNLPLPSSIEPPRGLWIVCGFGRFGRAVHRYLSYEGVNTIIIEPNREQAPEGAIIGRGTEAVTLREAGIENAVGIVAGSDNDSNNLSIIMTARELNADLYLVARQNRRGNDPIFRAARLDLVMQASRILVWRILPLLTAPVLSQFLRAARHRSESWAQELLQRIHLSCGDFTPLTFSISITRDETPALYDALKEGQELKIGHLLRDPQERSRFLPCVPLFIIRDQQEIMLPQEDEPLYCEDRLLMCAKQEGERQIGWTLSNRNALDYVITGDEHPDGFIWRWLARRKKQASAGTGNSGN